MTIQWNWLTTMSLNRWRKWWTLCATCRAAPTTPTISPCKKSTARLWCCSKPIIWWRPCPWNWVQPWKSVPKSTPWGAWPVPKPILRPPQLRPSATEIVPVPEPPSSMNSLFPLFLPFFFCLFKRDSICLVFSDSLYCLCPYSVTIHSIWNVFFDFYYWIIEPYFVRTVRGHDLQPLYIIHTKMPETRLKNYPRGR